MHAMHIYDSVYNIYRQIFCQFFAVCLLLGSTKAYHNERVVCMYSSMIIIHILFKSLLITVNKLPSYIQFTVLFYSPLTMFVFV